MANLFTVGIEVKSSAAQQAIAGLEKSFHGMAGEAAAAQQASEALGQSTGRLRDQFGRFISAADQAAGAVGYTSEEFKKLREETNRLKEETKRLAEEEKRLEDQQKKNKLAAAAALGLLSLKAKQYVDSGIQIGEATQGAIAANATLTNDSKGLDKTFQDLTKSLNYQTNSLELNKSAYDVLSAGVTKTADITQVMEAGVKGAKGGFSDLGTITDATTTIMNAFHKPASEANKIVDQMIQNRC